jgi:hypothetical protein
MVVGSAISSTGSGDGSAEIHFRSEFSAEISQLPSVGVAAGVLGAFVSEISGP